MNEGMFNEIKRRLDELIRLTQRLIDLMESQMTQPVIVHMPLEGELTEKQPRVIGQTKPAMKTTKAAKK